MQAAKKKVAQQLVKKVSVALDDPAMDLDQLCNLLNAAANYLQASQTIETLESDDVAEILNISLGHVKHWSKVPKQPWVRVGGTVRWPLHSLMQWLSVPGNVVDIAKYKSA